MATAVAVGLALARCSGDVGVSSSESNSISVPVPHGRCTLTDCRPSARRGRAMYNVKVSGADIKVALVLGWEACRRNKTARRAFGPRRELHFLELQRRTKDTYGDELCAWIRGVKYLVAVGALAALGTWAGAAAVPVLGMRRWEPRRSSACLSCLSRCSFCSCERLYMSRRLVTSE